MVIKIGIVALFVLSASWQTHAQSLVNCTATGAGRFAEPSDTTCQSYILCVLNTATSTYVSYNYTCPTTSVFNPTTAQCTASTNYVCPNNTINATNTTSLCTADGFIADPSSTDCSTYITCVQINGNFSQTTTTCPNGTLYNPTTTFCETNYICPTSTAGFSCTAAGRFANPSDITCQTYYLCVLPANGTYVNYEYTCPNTSVFSPTSRVCTTNYICPTS